MKKTWRTCPLLKFEFKIEIVVGCLLALAFALVKHIGQLQFIEHEITFYLQDFYSEANIATFTNISAILIGVYVNVIIILMTSRLSITEVLYKNNLDKRILGIIKVGLLEDALLIVLALFTFEESWSWLCLYTVLICISLISFLKFVLLLFQLFGFNLREMIAEIEDDKKRIDQLIIDVEEIKYVVKKLDAATQKHDE